MIRILGSLLVAAALIALAIPAWHHDRHRRTRPRERQLLRTINRRRRHPSDALGPADITRALASILRAQADHDRHNTRTHQEH